MAYEELIRKAKEYLAPESGEFESYYRKAAENLRADYNSSLAELKSSTAKTKMPPRLSRCRICET